MSLEKNLSATAEPKTSVAAKKKIKKEKMVTAEFKTWESEGGSVMFSYSDDEKPANKYSFIDGETYTIPLKIAEHINSCTRPHYDNKMDKQGNIIGSTKRLLKRFSFTQKGFSTD